MNKYLIKYKIATLAELVEGTFQYKGFEFSSFDQREYCNCEAWVATKEIEASNGMEAIQIFLKDLIPLIERFSILSQCAFRIIGNTYIVYRQTNNPEKIVYLYHSRETDAVGLHFDETQIEQLPKFEKMPSSNGLMYLFEASNTTTYYARLSLLLMAVEGLAGEIVKNGTKYTDKKMLIKILGTKLYEKLYTYGDGLRNVLIHGKAKDDKSFGGLASEIYSRIRLFLKNEYEIQIEENVVDPQRGFYGNFEVARMFEKFRGNPVLDLKIIEDALGNEGRINLRDQDIFTYCSESPKNY